MHVTRRFRDTSHTYNTHTHNTRSFKLKIIKSTEQPIIFRHSYYEHKSSTNQAASHSSEYNHDIQTLRIHYE